MKVYKLSADATLPKYATSGSAAFDLRAHFEVADRLVGYNSLNKKIELNAKEISGNPAIQIPPMFRVLIPTGLIFDIPEKHVLEIYPRSGMALKYGITLANCTAIIDSDYVQETFVMVLNISDSLVVISDGDRIAQAALKVVKQVVLSERPDAPIRKTERDGGLGSTGVQ